MRAIGLVLALGGFALASCGEGGIGAPCFPGGQDQPGNLKVLINTGECTTNICVSYLGSPGYCTVECDSAAACPSQYLCCPVVQTGATTPCQTSADCTSRQSCRQGQCRPKQFCVQGSGNCQ
jgi:hypothetical protein